MKRTIYFHTGWSVAIVKDIPWYAWLALYVKVRSNRRTSSYRLDLSKGWFSKYFTAKNVRLTSCLSLDLDVHRSVSSFSGAAQLQYVGNTQFSKISRDVTVEELRHLGDQI